MAALIRSARMDPERLLLAMRAPAGHAPARTEADARPAPPASEPLPPPPAEWTVPDAAALPDLGPPVIDLEAEARAFSEQLAAEREAALAAARDEGHAEGVRAGRAEYDEGLDTLATLIGSLREALAVDIAGAEDVIVEIAFESVCRIVGDAVTTRDGALAVVREVVQRAGEREKLLLRVAPADHELVLRHRAQLLPGDDARGLEVVADERVALGGALVETAGGTLDGRLETQLQRLADTLLAARRMPTEALP